ncbi:MAG: cbb3-type cytochrome oxidase assembly protein CcoS [Pseudomonadota bacterium]|mgnify:CR=1 FL=1
MTVLLLLIPVSLCLGAVGLAAFTYAVRANQFDDPEGNAARILDPEREARPDDQSSRTASPD